jgi:hypothetical protein
MIGNRSISEPEMHEAKAAREGLAVIAATRTQKLGLRWEKF